MSRILFNDALKDGFELLDICGHLYMYSDVRIEDDSIPDGYVKYDIRESSACEYDFSSIEPYVVVNYMGSIIGRDTLQFDEEGKICPNADERGYGFIFDEAHSIEAYERAYHKYVIHKLKEARHQKHLSVHDMAVMAYNLPERIVRILEDGGFTHPELAKRIQKAIGLSDIETEELMPPNRRPHGHNYNPDMYASKWTDAPWLRSVFKHNKKEETNGFSDTVD